MANRNTVTLSIMGRDYRLSVTPEEEEKLRVCAQIVEAKMKETVEFLRQAQKE